MTRLALLALAALLLLAPAAAAHEIGTNYESLVTGQTPKTDGLEFSIDAGSADLVAVNRSGRTLVIEGYDKEPYLRLRKDGIVEVNTHSPAHYLNEDAYANVDLPEQADAKAKPKWKQVGTDGRAAWHDHRIHWMSPKPPPQLAEERQRTKVFDWRVPISVGDKPGAVTGTLWWNGVSAVPAWASAAVFGGCLLLVLAAGAIWWRKNRGAEPPDAEQSDDEAEAKEAW